MPHRILFAILFYCLSLYCGGKNLFIDPVNINNLSYIDEIEETVIAFAEEHEVNPDKNFFILSIHDYEGGLVLTVVLNDHLDTEDIIGYYKQNGYKFCVTSSLKDYVSYSKEQSIKMVYLGPIVDGTGKEWVFFIYDNILYFVRFFDGRW